MANYTVTHAYPKLGINIQAKSGGLPPKQQIKYRGLK